MGGLPATCSRRGVAVDPETLTAQIDLAELIACVAAVEGIGRKFAEQLHAFLRKV